jgi:hypothetical protein
LAWLDLAFRSASGAGIGGRGDAKARTLGLSAPAATNRPPPPPSRSPPKQGTATSRAAQAGCSTWTSGRAAARRRRRGRRRWSTGAATRSVRRRKRRRRRRGSLTQPRESRGRPAAGGTGGDQSAGQSCDERGILKSVDPTPHPTPNPSRPPPQGTTAGRLRRATSPRAAASLGTTRWSRPRASWAGRKLPAAPTPLLLCAPPARAGRWVAFSRGLHARPTLPSNIPPPPPASIPPPRTSTASAWGRARSSRALRRRSPA